MRSRGAVVHLRSALNPTGRPRTDIGALAESLVYHDVVHMIVDHPEDVADLIRWFLASLSLDEFLSLLEADILCPVFREYQVGALGNSDGLISGLAVFTIERLPRDIIDTVIARSPVYALLGQGRSYRRVRASFRLKTRVIEQTHDVQPALREAERDFLNSVSLGISCKQLACSYMPHLSDAIVARDIVCIRQVATCDAKPFYEITWNTSEDLSQLFQRCSFAFPPPSHLLMAAGDCYDRLRIASQLGTDLSPSHGDRPLYDLKMEHAARELTSRDIVRDLTVSVGFPSIRDLVSNGQLTARDVLQVREKSSRLRKWLAEERIADAEAAAGHHRDLGEATGLIRFGTGVFSLFGMLAGAGVGAAVEVKLQNAGHGIGTGAVVGSGIGTLAAESSRYLSLLTRQLATGWTPAIHGTRLARDIRSRIARSGRAIDNLERETEIP